MRLPSSSAILAVSFQFTRFRFETNFGSKAESQGFFIHQQAGLPAARQVLHAVFSSLSDPSAAPTELSYRVMCLSVEKFAWNAQEELETNVCLEEAEEEMLLEALADFLSAHRPR